ncbi:MAG TPA: SURF1 family protein [Acidimicrobiales bacterium]|nr:SURF1 family protein [Acidimicrobiales bacterium]
MRSWRFLLGPLWILSHLLVVLLAVVMVNLGFWQLHRLDERKAENALIEARQERDPVALDDVLTADADDATVDELRARPVTLEGRYDDDATVTVHNRTQDGVPGDWMVTPLVLEGGDRVGVIRGFVGLGPEGDPYPAAAPEGRVEVEGAVMVPRLQDRTVRKDLEDLLAAPDTLPVLVRAEESDPPEPAAAAEDGSSDPRETLVPLPPPELSERNHLSYAFQWFIFSTIAVVGYPLVLRRVLQRRGKEADDAGGDGDDNGGDGAERVGASGAAT